MPQRQIEDGLLSVLFVQHVIANRPRSRLMGDFLIAEHEPLNHFAHEAGEPLWFRGGAPRDNSEESPGET
jgi:hypothetical protein